ncbi:antibiotic biosynthesis monooxygenase [Pleurocapsales cyanobacterium LEGE 10410]|nr:antibiotic biosynthesis monooxygenase [Pleurocapsales cyanobacterium LEGE 10410]
MTATLTRASDKQQVTAVICHLVKPGQERKYEQWLHEVSAVAQQFEGHSGVSFIRPTDPANPEYAIVLKFDCYKNLQNWLDSPVRRRWIDKAKPFVQQDQRIQVLTGLETWFTVPGKRGQPPPKRYKMSILTTLAVFLVSQPLSQILGPLLQFIPSLLRALILTFLTVLLLTYVIMPRVTRLFYRWLYG